jgi:hypothetical protein
LSPWCIGRRAKTSVVDHGGCAGDVKSAIAMVKFGLRAKIGTSISVTRSRRHLA